MVYSYTQWSNLFDLLDERSQKSQHYPPHNVIKIDEENYLIELAVAGFSKKDIDINLEKNKLVISGKKDIPETVYIHQGISNRSFEKTFMLAQDVQVSGATYADGILGIDLKRVIPEEFKPRKISIW